MSPSCQRSRRRQCNGRLYVHRLRPDNPGVRASALLLLFAAACASTGDGPREGFVVRVTARQFYEGSLPVAVENVGGRDVVELRSRRIPAGQAPVAYVDDETMRRLLRALDRHGFSRRAAPHAGAASALGARAEVVVRRGDAPPLAVQRRPGQRVEEAEAFQACFQEVLAVYDATPKMQASAGGADALGVKKARFAR